jgi:hypothetical protein
MEESKTGYERRKSLVCFKYEIGTEKTQTKGNKHYHNRKHTDKEMNLESVVLLLLDSHAIRNTLNSWIYIPSINVNTTWPRKIILSAKHRILTLEETVAVIDLVCCPQQSVVYGFSQTQLVYRTNERRRFR